jgi:hypothetical protein
MLRGNTTKLRALGRYVVEKVLMAGNVSRSNISQPLVSQQEIERVCYYVIHLSIVLCSNLHFYHELSECDVSITSGGASVSVARDWYV